jgi:hypothetical protein
VNNGVIAGGAGALVTDFRGTSATGGAAGVVVSVSGGMLSNTGRIAGGAGGVVNDYNGFGNTGGAGGVGVSLSSGSLTNIGTVAGGAGGSVFDTNGTSDTGGAGGAGISLSGGTLTNIGRIAGGAGGAVNDIFGHLKTGGAGGVGVFFNGAGTLIDSGAIVGGGSADAVDFGAGASRLILNAGASFVGKVVANASFGNTLELAAGAVAGTLGGIGSQYLGFSQIVEDSGASWTLAGTNTIGAGVTLSVNSATLTDTGILVNNGGIVLDPSTAILNNLIGTGSITIQAGSTLTVQGTIASGETIAFAGTNGLLQLAAPLGDAGTIVGFAATDSLDLSGVIAGSVTYAATGGGVLNFSRVGGGTGSIVARGAGAVTSQSDGSGGALVTSALCFCAGTRIATPAGEVLVQDLPVGDLVTTHGGAERPIAWIGTGAVLATRGKRGPATPVIIRKSAFAANVPNRDLRVTKGHSFLFDNVLIPAEFLVNHRSIEWDDRAQEVTLYHVELETHDILIANGAPAESYRDDDNRWLFRNANSGWDQPAKEPCAPVLTGGPIVDAVWRQLLDRAGARPGVPLTDDPDVHLLVDGLRVDAHTHRGNARRFRLCKRPNTVIIASRSAAPQELGLSRDPRVLGVAIRRLLVRHGPLLATMAAGDPQMADGFHPFEPELGLRWTDGRGAVPAALFDGMDGETELEVVVTSTARYCADDRAAA